MLLFENFIITVTIIVTIILTITITITIKKGRQRKAEREQHTPHQSEDPSPTIPTYRQKEEKGKRVEDYIVGIEQLRPIKKHWPCS